MGAVSKKSAVQTGLLLASGVFGLIVGYLVFSTSERSVQVHEFEKDRILLMDATRRAILIAERDQKKLYCMEPSPDVSTDVERLFESNIGSKTVVSENSKIVDLLQRTQGLQNMRDVLFRACEANINGFINDTQYNQLLNHALTSGVALMTTELLTGSDVSTEDKQQILQFIQILIAQP